MCINTLNEDTKFFFIKFSTHFRINKEMDTFQITISWLPILGFVLRTFVRREGGIKLEFRCLFVEKANYQNNVITYTTSYNIYICMQTENTRIFYTWKSVYSMISVKQKRNIIYIFFFNFQSFSIAFVYLSNKGSTFNFLRGKFYY